MSTQDFDDIVKKEFSDYTPNVPEHIWDNIAALRKKKRRPALWFLLNRNNLIILALLLTGTGAAWWFSTQSTDNNITSTNQSTTGSNIQPTDNSTANKNNSAADKKIDANNIATLQENNLAIPNNDKLAPNQNSSNNNSTIKQSGNSSTDKNINTSTASTNTQQHVPGNGNYSPFNSLPPVQAVISPKSKRKLKLGLRKNGADINTLSGDEGLDDTNADATTVDQSTTTASGSLMYRLQYGVEKLTLKTKKTLPLFNMQIPSANPKCPRLDDPAGDKQYFEIYAGPDFAFRNITDTANTSYLQKRKESEKFSSAVSAGVRYTRVFNNGVSLRTGINYSQINEKFTYSKGGIIQYVYILDQTTGDTIGSYQISGSRYKTTYNRYRTIDIPLQIGYEMGNGRLHANLGAGVMVNIYSWQRGDVLDTSLAPVNITTGKSSSPYGFKTNTGVGFLASASLYYKLTERLHLMAEPYFRYSISPMSKENLTITQKYSTAGIRIGIRWDLK